MRACYNTLLPPPPSQLATRGVAAQQRTLPLGDMMWVARRRVDTTRPMPVSEARAAWATDEWVLNFIVERKVRCATI